MKRLLMLFLMIVSVLAATAERPAPEVVADGRPARATILAAGDFVIHDNLIKSASDEAEKAGSALDCDFSPMLEPIRSALSAADFTVVNVDGVFLGNAEKPYGGYPRFNTPPSLLNALKGAGVDMLTMANNHALDFWYDGLKASLDRVDDAGLMHIGAARTREERNTPAIVDVCGIRFGFLNYTTYLNGIDRYAGLDPDAMDFGICAESNSDFDADVRKLREEGAEIVVCFMHWGTEYRETPDSKQLQTGKKLVYAGVDVIVGGHPHVVQRADWLTGTNQFGEKQRTLCVYSLGNFLSGQRKSGRDGGILFEFTAERDESGCVSVTDARYVSTWVWQQGSESLGYTYRILPVAEYADNRPAGMTSAEHYNMRFLRTIHEKAVTSGNLRLPEDGK